MDNELEKIDDYLNGNMNAEERAQFEAEMALNEDLSSSFKVYSRIETEMRSSQKYSEDAASLKNSLQQLNTKYFKAEAQQPGKVVSFNTRVYKIVASIAAVLIIVVAGYFLLADRGFNSEQIASKYIEENLTDLSLKMDASQDSMQRAKVLFKNKEFDKATSMFALMYNRDSTNSDALKFEGLGYLQMNEYDKAMAAFDQLSNKELFSNPGIFYKAITLMKRDKQGDKEQAKTLLQQVVSQKAQGHEVAEEWLKEWK